MEYLLNTLDTLINRVPILVYVTFGGLVEEIIAPIPSPLVMVSAGSLAQEQGKLPVFVFVISFFAAIGKTIGSLVIYYIADKTEDIFLTRFGKFLGVSHKEIESLGKKFDNTWKDDLIIILLRAVPIFPGTPVALVCGLIKINIRTYIQSTFIGVFIRSLIFGFVGYLGMSQLDRIIANTEGIGDLVVYTIIVLVFGGFVYKRRDKIQKALLKTFRSLTKQQTD